MVQTTPKETTPKETTPKETTPKETAPKETSPKETTPKETTPKSVEKKGEEKEEKKVRVYNKRKRKYNAKLKELFSKYNKLLIINVDNVRSKQLQQVRKELRGKIEMIMGKNTMMRRIIRELIEENANKYGLFKKILPSVKGNMGFIFVEEKENLGDIRSFVSKNKVEAAAKVGSIAPCDVSIPAGPTGLDPGQTSFFQVLSIATRIVKGNITIADDVPLIKEGDKVTSSQVSLLSKLGMKPFFYGIKVLSVFDNGELYDAKILDLNRDVILSRFYQGVNLVASVSLQLGFPTKPSIPHSIMHTFSKLLAVAVQTKYSFKEAEAIKQKLAPKKEEKAEEKKDDKKDAKKDDKKDAKKDTKTEAK